MRIVTYLFLVIVIILGLSFAVLNRDVVTIHFYLGQKALPLSLLLVATFAIGCFFGLLVGFWVLLKAKLRNYSLKHRLKIAEKEIQNLRTIPLQDRT